MLAQKLTVTALAAPLVHRPRSALPVIISVPHSGRDYPAELIDSAARGRAALESLEDPLVDRLAWRALARGLGAVIARAPRAAIDCNRAESEVDPAVVTGASRANLSARTRGGLGLVPARTSRYGYLWRRPLSRTELESRIETAYQPYHSALEAMIDDVYGQCGCVLLIDCHSMPPPGDDIPPIIIGDAFERSAPRWLSEMAAGETRNEGFGARRNDPFAGGHVIQRHADPARRIYALQLEIDRRLYLDSTMMRPGPGFDRMARFLDRLAVTLGNEVLDRSFAAAAE